MSNYASYSNGSSKLTSTAGDYVTITFTGTGVSWYGARASSRGIANVYIDGELEDTDDQYGSSAVFKQKIFGKTGLSQGSHTIKIECTGTNNGAANGVVTEIDFIEVNN